MDEIKLVKKAKKGDAKAFEELLVLHSDQLYRTAYLYVGHKEDALDIVQETAYKAYLSLTSLKEPLYFKTWLMRILINTAYEVLRTQKKIVKLKDENQIDSITFSNNTIHSEISIDLQEAIWHLEENYQKVIILYYYHDLPIQQISWNMNVPEGTVKTYLHRARKELKKLLEGSDPTWINNGLMMK